MLEEEGRQRWNSNTLATAKNKNVFTHNLAFKRHGTHTCAAVALTRGGVQNGPRLVRTKAFPSSIIAHLLGIFYYVYF